MQTLQLTYAENIAMETLALIFVNTELKVDGNSYEDDLTYNNAEDRAETARQTFDMLGFDKVKVDVNFNKKQVIQRFNQAQGMADAFKSVDGKIMHISVMYVGFLAMSGADCVQDHGYDRRKEGCKYPQYFALTNTGEPVGL